MKVRWLLGLGLAACSEGGGNSSSSALQLAVEDRGELQATWDDARDERLEQLAMGGGGPKCKELNVPLASIDPDRSLFVHDKATLDGADFSLRRTLQTLADQAIQGGADAATTTAELMFEKLWEDQTAVAPATTCPDATGMVNGFPYECRIEGDQAANAALEIDNYFPIAIVNRIDLASDDWTDCGEHRIVYARTPVVNDRNLVIFESVLPNPKEGCQEGCRTVARWWAELSQQTDPVVRAGLIEDLYYRPLGRGPKGFRPVVHFNHYSEAGVDTPKLTSKGGQIRTNQRLVAPWQLKQLKTLLDCSVQPCIVDLVPVAVSMNPFSSLFDSNEEFTGQSWSPLVPLFQDDFLANRDLLATGTSAIDFTYAPDPLFDAGQSTVRGIEQDYASLTDATFLTEIETGGPVGFTGTQLLNRATALSCAGCHDPQTFALTDPDSIGTGLSVPDTLRFAHTDDVVTPALLSATTHFGNGDGFVLSPALIGELIPARADNLIVQLNQQMCVCQPPVALLSHQGRADRNELARMAGIALEDAIVAYEDLRDENDRLEAAGVPIDRSSEQAALDAIDRVMEESDAAMFALLAREGHPYDSGTDLVSMSRATPFRTTPGDDLASAVQDAIDSRPRRRTALGTFATH